VSFLLPLIACALVFWASLLFFAPVFVYHRVVKRRKARLPPGDGASGDALRPDRTGNYAFDRLDEKLWLDVREAETARIVSRDGLELFAYYLRAGAAPARGVAILAHGYTRDARVMGPEARFFSGKLGFNTLIPDARGHGRSEGSYTGFGWHERLDYLDWIRWALETADGGEAPPVVLYGVSMGASTVMMVSGEAALPPQVAAVIEDCGYTSLEEELAFQFRRYYHIRSRRLLEAAGRYTKKKAGFSFDEVSALNQIKKSQVPTLFIHGDADDFVPFSMVHRLYEACAAPRELFVVPGAGHAESYMKDPEAYEARIRAFLDTRVPGAQAWRRPSGTGAPAGGTGDTGKDHHENRTVYLL
jgi:fermentation-respiration switch protein FrsA (DUF1100 family)